MSLTRHDHHIATPTAVNRRDFILNYLMFPELDTLATSSACPICFEPFTATGAHRPNQANGIGDCKHIFCYRCMSHYLQSDIRDTRTCPIYRQKWYYSRSITPPMPYRGAVAWTRSRRIHEEVDTGP
ncbi:hypothetical protein P280DRAFT_477153 [Massarina eburnea CBS 473.64]|uniref:RING-type domain-containing protein n=1 Tax=Massarina eburnea CBS 473.64 TaxID=1395130 RepID=A0A6A6S7V3_9PLEO|nr:hypothetical protein P280DRAFT_477153 [Massarina eburnea CBS 473.64]